MDIRVISSGSAGNCYLIDDGKTALLLDAGIAFSEIQKAMNFDTSHIQKSIEILKKSTIDYEFRTTVVKEFHQESDFDAMYDLLKGARLWRLQEFRDSPNCFSKNLHPIPSDELKLLISRYLSDKTIQIY